MPSKSYPRNVSLYIDDIPMRKIETVDIGGDECTGFIQTTQLENRILRVEMPSAALFLFSGSVGNV